MMKRLIAGLFGASAILHAGFAHAAFPVLPKSQVMLPKSSHISMRGSVYAPLGSLYFCKQNPNQCVTRSARGITAHKGAIVLDAKSIATINAINRSVNRSMRPLAERFGDRWEIGTRSGDCEDYALTKRDKLIRSGFPTSAVLMATATVPGMGEHAVLVVRTDAGDYVLDNLTDKVLPWKNTKLWFKTIQSPDNPKSWKQI